MTIFTTFKHLGPTIKADEFQCARCLAVFRYVAVAVPNEPDFVVSDNPPQYCPECGASRQRN
jgi:rubrerythrin